MAQPKAASGSGEGGLQPGLSEKGPSAEALQTRPDLGVKVSGRRDPKCKNHAAVGSAVTQEQKACLRVRKPCQGLGVGLWPDGGAQEVHCPLLADLDALRESPSVNHTELQTNLTAGGGEAGQCSSYLAGPASKAGIVKKSKGELGLLSRHSGGSCLQGWVQG